MSDREVLLAAAAVALALLIWACVSLSRLARSAGQTNRELQHAARQLALMSRAVSSSALTAQEDRLARQARRLALTVVQQYSGEPAANLPGAVVVRVHNASDDFAYDLLVMYSPPEGEPQFDARALLPPHHTYDATFALHGPPVKVEQLLLRYVDSRGAPWAQRAGSPVAVRLDPDPSSDQNAAREVA
ncbi:hypothetical protein [Dactylosporangium sp. NPDC005555]|uniref:hypothetical protein n=1 Tax=Dactylosporangium sp. NPDC005555 TaxID=3154889 RepID=UPI0033BE00ED